MYFKYDFMEVYVIVFLFFLGACGNPVTKKEVNSIVKDESYVEKQENKYNKIPPEELVVLGLGLGSSTNEIVEELGEPGEITEHVNEFDGTIFYNYHYKDNVLVVSADEELVGFHIKSKGIKVRNTKIGIGDSEQLLKDLFPLSFENKMQKDSSSGQEILRVELGNKFEYILFIIESGKIREILDWQSE